MRKIIKLGCLIFISLIIGDIALATEESGRVSIPWKDFRGLLGLDKDEENFDQRINEIQSEPETAYIAGTLPIRIQIPTAGQIYRFAKTIVSEEPVKLKFTYTGDRKSVV